MLDESQLPLPDKRRYRRARSAHPVSVRARGSNALPAKLSDLSSAGCRIGGVLLRRDDTPYWIRLPGIESKAARVVWCDHDQAGLAFEQPLHPAVAERIAGSAHDSSADEWSAPAATPMQDKSRPGGSRREQIMAGYVLPDPGILLDKKPLAGGNSMMGLVRRTSRRTSDHRTEPRFEPPVAAGLGFVVQDRPAQLTDISSSGVRLAGELSQEIGEQVQLRFAGCEPMAAQVVWKRSGMVGLALPAGAIGLTLSD